MSIQIVPQNVEPPNSVNHPHTSTMSPLQLVSCLYRRPSNLRATSHLYTSFLQTHAREPVHPGVEPTIKPWNAVEKSACRTASQLPILAIPGAPSTSRRIYVRTPPRIRPPLTFGSPNASNLDLRSSSPHRKSARQSSRPTKFYFSI
ncbi:hypothetical protein BDZ97DRAFT_1220991 [Flammula alnicola]|nr:hypothetical protein BDZ97DRAFT_1220991 [Flammula alnicola]